MGRALLIIVFLVMTGVSVGYIVVRKETTIRSRMAKDPAPSLITIEDFSIYQYAGDDLTSTLSGRYAHFLDPNLLEMYGDLRAVRHHSDHQEYLRAKTSVTYFKKGSIFEILGDRQVERSEVENDVELGFSNYTLSTHYAQYRGDEKKITSDYPTLVVGDRAKLTSRSGFSYDLDSQDVEFPQSLQGVFFHDSQGT